MKGLCHDEFEFGIIIRILLTGSIRKVRFGVEKVKGRRLAYSDLGNDIVINP